MISSRWVVTPLMAAALLVQTDAKAQTYPDRPVVIVTGFAAGGGTDVTARLLGPKLTEKWHQPILVDNKPGADATIAESYVAHSKPDGYTLMMINSNHIVAPNLHELNYDIMKSFVHIMLIDSHPFALVVNPSVVPAKNLEELIALIRAQPGKFNYASTGPSSGPFLAMGLMAQALDLKVVNVSYKGTSAMIPALLGGEIQMGFEPIPELLEHLKSGKLKALAVSSPRRMPQLPDVPTVAEAANIPGFDSGSWDGLIAPAGTPPDIVKKIHDDVAEVVKIPEIRNAIVATGSEIILGSPQEFDKFVVDNSAKFSALLKTMDIKKE